MSKTPSIDRTPEAARAAVDDAYAEFCATAGDEVAKRVVSKDLVEEVLTLAWQRQFDEDRAQTRRKLQEIVTDRVTELGAGAV